MEFCKQLRVEHSKTVLINSLLESSAERPLDILDTDPYPSDLTLALFAKLVKTENMPSEKDAEYGMRLVLPEGWRLLVTGRSNLGHPNRYFGAAFVHAKSQQVVVAHRGVIRLRTNAPITSTLGIVRNHHTGITSSAVTFTEFIRQVVHSANADHGRHYNIAITGHSSGGWLAQITALTVKCLMEWNGVLIKNTSGEAYAKTVVFDSPGAKDILNQIQDSQALNVSLDALNITVYVLAPNSLNIQGEHIGKVNRIFIDLPKLDYGSDILSFSMYQTLTHNMTNFIEAFTCNTPEINELTDWAGATTEFSALFDYSNQGNEWNLTDKLGNSLFENLNRFNMAKFKSQIDDQIVKCDFNCFAEEELKVLNILYFLQEKKPGVEILKAFVSQNKLQIENSRLFPEFEIDLYNKIIMCKSRNSLDELIRRLKQLMRWLGSQFTEAVEEEIVAFHLDVTIGRRRQNVNLIYRAEETRYLDSLPKTSLTFKDSVGLKDFLVSDTDRVLCVVTQDGAFEMTRLHSIFTQLKKTVDTSDPIYKYTGESHYGFLDWPRLQNLYKEYDSPIDQIDLMMVDGISSSTMSLEDCTFLSNYVHCSSSKKLVFISSKEIEILKFLQNIKHFIAHRKITLMNLSDESQNIILEKIKSGEFS